MRCYFLELFEKDELVIFLQMVYETGIIISFSVLILRSSGRLLGKAFQVIIPQLPQLSQLQGYIKEIQEFGTTTR